MQNKQGITPEVNTVDKHMINIYIYIYIYACRCVDMLMVTHMLIYAHMYSALIQLIGI